ncbi:MAG: FAD binding domain-containing protein [Bacillota bacterium]|nr:FAD binding domain-containing protein [Bacillota bacterium]
MSVLSSFDYFKPATIEQALALWEKYKRNVRYIAGGTDVLVQMKAGKPPADYLVSLLNISDLSYIKQDNNGLRIGPLTTHRQLELSDIIKDKYPVLHDAVKQIGSVQIRNVATIGGNLCSALPSADTASPLLVLNAQLKVVGVQGERLLSLTDFFISPGKNALEASDILTEILIPAIMGKSGAAYIKLGRRRAMEIPLIGAAVYLAVNERGFCSEARVALTTSAPIPLRSPVAEEALIGSRIDEKTLQNAGEQALMDTSPRTSWRTTAEYRKKVIPVLIIRAGLLALERLADKT